MIATQNEKENIEKLVNEPQPVGCESKRTDKASTCLANVFVYSITKDAIETCKSCKDYIDVNGTSLCVAYEKIEEVKPLVPTWFWNVMDNYKTLYLL